MTRPLIARRGFAAIVAGLTLLVASCGGGGGDAGNANWRAVNLSNDIASADVYADASKVFSAVASEGVTPYQSIAVTSYAAKVTTAGDTASVLSGAFTFSPSKDKSYTAVITGRSGTARLATLLDDEDTSGTATGTARVRVYNASPESGALDVYISNAADIAEVSPTVSGIGAASVGGFRDVSAGTYRLRVTGAGDVNDVRLDISGLTVASKEASTIVITAGVSGQLANAAKIVQGGAVTALKNTQARVRVVAGVLSTSGSDPRSVDVSIAGQAFTDTDTVDNPPQQSPSLGSYKRIASGNDLPIVLTVNGAVKANLTSSFAAGGDYTVIVYGTSAAPQVQVLTDDNRLPASGRYRIRMVNVDSSQPGLTLQVDSQELDPIIDVQPGTTSSFATASANSTALVEIITSSNITQIYSKDDVNLASLGVYTLFVIGGKTDLNGNLLPTVQLRKDR